jgi:transposase
VKPYARHKVREMLVSQRTQLINALRGHLAEIGLIAARGLNNARELADLIMAEGDETIPACVRAALASLVRRLMSLMRKSRTAIEPLLRWRERTQANRAATAKINVG